MASRVLWMIDTELDGSLFERVCIDLLYRNGYRDIVPVEPQDGGRDAEEFPRQGRGRDGCAAFFQFSLERDWKRKLRRDAKKLRNRRSEFSSFVFVTNQKARGVDVDSLKTEFRQEYGWTLHVYSREWLRLQLEEAHPDISKRHLGIDISSSLSQPLDVFRFSELEDERLSEVRARFAAGAYESAIPVLKAFLENQPESAVAWQALAWSHYYVHQLDEALSDINRALKLKDSSQALSIRACIITEKGIAEGNKNTVREGFLIFEQLLTSGKVQTWHIFYNLGNALSALGKYQDAIIRYKQALELDSRKPEIWKNLATAHHRVGDHQAEMQCFDEALELDPLKPEALVSKAVSLIIDFKKPDEAVPLLESALKHSPELAVRWRPIWYWLGMAHQQSGSLRKALACVNDGLDHQPGDLALKRLKSELLASLAPQSPDLVEEARRFWEIEIANQPFDYDTRSRLIRLEAQERENSAAWRLLDEYFGLIEVHPVMSLKSSQFDIAECISALKFLPQYAAYRESQPISDYWNREDPLYDFPFAPPHSNKIEAALTTFFSIPFGLGSLFLEEHSVAKGKNITNFFDTLRVNIEHALIEAARELAALIPREQGNEAIAGKLTEIIMFLGLIALREFGRQRGWIAGQFRISSASLNGAMDSYDEGQIEKNVMSKSIISINEEVHIFSS